MNSYQKKTYYMILCKKVFLIIFFLPCLCLSQDIYNLENSLNFAKHLKKQGDLNFSLEEYTRCYYMDSENKQVQIEISNIYRLLKEYEEVITFTDKLIKRNVLVEKERMYALLMTNNHQKLNVELNQNKFLLEKEDIDFFKISSMLMQNKWHDAKQFLDQKKENEIAFRYQSIIEQQSSIKKKNPALALVMSIAVPGLGQFYTGNKKDALFSFLTIGLGTWQSYTSFKNSGVNSISGWLYGGVSLFFYSGNLYGSYTGAKSFNQQKDDFYNEKVYNISNTYMQ